MLPNFFFPSVMRISSESFWKNSGKMLPTGLETQEEKIIIQRNTLCPGGYVSEWSLVSWGSLEICDGNWGVNLNGLVSRVLDWRAKQSCQQQTCPPPLRPTPQDQSWDERKAITWMLERFSLLYPDGFLPQLKTFPFSVVFQSRNKSA